MPDTPILTESEIAALRKIEQLATCPEAHNVNRYDHGGGRVFIDGKAGERELIADFYGLEERELWIAARNAMPRLLDSHEALRKELSYLKVLHTAASGSYRIANHDNEKLRRERDALLGIADAAYEYVYGKTADSIGMVKALRRWKQAPKGPNMEEHETVVEGGAVWKVRVSGEWLQIVDDQGRERHRSRTHALTGEYLAGELAKSLQFRSDANLDDALRVLAKRFPPEE